MSNDGMQSAKEPRLVRFAEFLASRGVRRVSWCVLLTWLGLVLGTGVWDSWNERQDRDRLLNHTDHHTLLKACRDLMRNHPDVTISDPNHDPRVPEIIRRLGATYITIKPDFVHIELHGGFDHYGVEAFAEGTDRERGLRLIDGLWFYTAG